ncbi:hypothetical protein KIM372_14560 [Bombiscardovia nodaiensis]|uniref:Uncharacterized protein n=1 Tax=Bombiscardovia nodaiensis TaxID=2932181 RepID=A0ABM8B9J3_9BIFI|nr:hypothetical protein KIM372_14560 [Bombiscardovia nodaiensis]
MQPNTRATNGCIGYMKPFIRPTRLTHKARGEAAGEAQWRSGTRWGRGMRSAGVSWRTTWQGVP